MRCLAVSLIFAVVSTAAAAMCAPRDLTADFLAKEFDQVAHSMGIDANGNMMELYVSESGGTWTITVTMPTGVTCLAGSGTAFETAAKRPPDPGEDS